MHFFNPFFFVLSEHWSQGLFFIIGREKKRCKAIHFKLDLTLPDGGLSAGRGIGFLLFVLGKIPGFLGASSGGLFSICFKDQNFPCVFFPAKYKH